MFSIDKVDVCYRNYEEFVIVYNLRNKEIIKLENVAADIWMALSKYEEIDIDLIIKQILDIYDCNQEDIEEDIKQFVEELYDMGYVKLNGAYKKNEEKELKESKSNIDDFESKIIQDVKEKGVLYSVTFEMTYACNEKCIHCYANYPTDSNKSVVITNEQYKKVIDELYEMNCMHIAFTGGDPFMYKEFEEIFTYAREKGFVCDIYTNGVFLAENQDVLYHIIRLRPRAFYISLYGSKAELHDGITTVNGSFDKTITTISKLTEAGISVVLNVMLLSVNYGDLDEIINIAKMLNAEYRVGMSLIYKNDGDSSPMNYFIEDKNKIKSVLKRIRENVYSIDRAMGEERETDSLCGAGATSLAISPDGTIYPCISMKIPLGNILEENVGDVWNGERRRKLVESLTWNNTEDCKNCSSKKNCPHCPAISLAESGNLFLCNTCDKTIAECARELEVADE